MTSAALTALTAFIKQLEQHEMPHTLASWHPDAITVCVSLPSERWEVAFCNDGTVAAERFINNSEIVGEDAVMTFFERAFRKGRHI